MNTRLYSFPPITSPQARVLIVGSMPGAASLAAGQYYAHPRNSFWWILGEIVGQPLPEKPYPQRVAALQSAGIAVWDVLKACEREGSLDSAINLRQAELNDFVDFFQQHPRLERVLCNGLLAYQLFSKQAMPTLQQAFPERNIHIYRMPSTSPAHAGMNREIKVNEWRMACV